MKIKVKAIKIVQSQPTNLINSKDRKFARKRRLIFKVTTRSASSAFAESNDDDIIIQPILPRDSPLVNLNTHPENISSSDGFSDPKSTLHDTFGQLPDGFCQDFHWRFWCHWYYSHEKAISISRSYPTSEYISCICGWLLYQGSYFCQFSWLHTNAAPICSNSQSNLWHQTGGSPLA